MPASADSEIDDPPAYAASDCDTRPSTSEPDAPRAAFTASAVGGDATDLHRPGSGGCRGRAGLGLLHVGERVVLALPEREHAQQADQADPGEIEADGSSTERRRERRAHHRREAASKHTSEVVGDA